MTNLDSRSLTYVDTFGRRFGEPGQVRYRIVSPSIICQPARDDLPFTIDVEGGQGGEQHDVTVRLEGDRLVADPPQLKIADGDVVLWHSLSSTPGYAVQGESETGRFDSSSFTDGTLYTHAFGAPGDYEWVDAIKRSVSGVVEVASLDPSDRQQCGEWMEALEQGTLVVIDGKRSDPPKVSILAGQTVFFAVAAADGITITDSLLVTGGPDTT
jgi:plastocyanin